MNFVVFDEFPPFVKMRFEMHAASFRWSANTCTRICPQLFMDECGVQFTSQRWRCPKHLLSSFLVKCLKACIDEIFITYKIETHLLAPQVFDIHYFLQENTTIPLTFKGEKHWILVVSTMRWWASQPGIDPYFSVLPPFANIRSSIIL